MITINNKHIIKNVSSYKSKKLQDSAIFHSSIFLYKPIWINFLMNISWRRNFFIKWSNLKGHGRSHKTTFMLCKGIIIFILAFWSHYNLTFLWTNFVPVVYVRAMPFCKYVKLILTYTNLMKFEKKHKKSLKTCVWVVYLISRNNFDNSR